MLSTSTLFVALFAAFALFGLTLAVARRSLPESPALGIWARGTWLTIAGFVLIVSRAVGPAWLAIIGGNALVMAGLWFNAQALHRFIQDRPTPKLQSGLFVLGAVTVVSFVGQPLPLRTAVVSLLIAAQIAPMVILALGKGWHAEPSLRTVGITLALTMVALVVRAVHATVSPEQYVDFFQVSLGNGITYLASYLFPLGAGIGFVLANLERATRSMAMLSSQLQQLTREQQAMLDTELIGITRLRDRRSLWTNRALEAMFGYEPGELAGAPSRLLYLDQEAYEALGRDAYPALQSGQTYRAQVQMRRKNGDPIWVDLSGVLLGSDSGESLWMMQDITEQKLRQQRVEQIAFHDALTGLPNRVLLSDRIGQTLLLCDRLKSRCAVCFLDLDGFKAVNDARGHDAGDRLLTEIGRRIQSSVRASDTAARLGGDEFVLLLSPVDRQEDCEEILHRVLASIAEPIILGDGPATAVTASIGVVIHPDVPGGADELLSYADRAMYTAKRAGRNQVCYWR
ncbi:diguanylate cyclase domain-containing protein [Roseateles sp. BYS78W]|uniref:Diguanylate cyclase domain-containing protein n=1 Tax=Pelomonas candidula TaxID=3299025 RepID=A0ABW7HAR3_9BURK